MGSISSIHSFLLQCGYLPWKYSTNCLFPFSYIPPDSKLQVIFWWLWCPSAKSNGSGQLNYPIRQAFEICNPSPGSYQTAFSSQTSLRSFLVPLWLLQWAECTTLSILIPYPALYLAEVADQANCTIYLAQQNSLQPTPAANQVRSKQSLSGSRGRPASLRLSQWVGERACCRAGDRAQRRVCWSTNYSGTTWNWSNTLLGALIFMPCLTEGGRWQRCLHPPNGEGSCVHYFCCAVVRAQS